MAAPASAIAAKIQGLREAKAAFQAMPALFRKHSNAATETTVREIARHAQARLLSSPSILTRSLYNNIAWKMNENNGRGKVGVATATTVMQIGTRKIRVKGIIVAGKGGSALSSQGAKVIRPTRYSHFVEFGTRHMPAEPFMIPAAKSQEMPYLDRMKQAGRAVEQDMANIGLRNL